MRRRCSGFTLVELLVVIGIIAVLMGILLPSLSKARKSSRRLKCQATLRQYGSAQLMYVGEQKGWCVPIKTETGSSPKGVYGTLTYMRWDFCYEFRKALMMRDPKNIT